MGRVRPPESRACLIAPLLLAVAGSLAGCAGAGDLFSRDAEWFNRPSRIFTSNLSLETPPLSEQRPVAPDDLVSADGYCSGMAPPSDANAMTEGDPSAQQPAAPTAPTGPAGIALGRTECEVARYAGHPDNVELSNDQRGDRVAVLTFLKGPRPGIYHFTAGRLSSVERAPVPAAPEKPKIKPKKRATT